MTRFSVAPSDRQADKAPNARNARTRRTNADLQRGFGNRATLIQLQRKTLNDNLTHPAEIQADEIAERVMRTPQPKQKGSQPCAGSSCHCSDCGPKLKQGGSSFTSSKQAAFNGSTSVVSTLGPQSQSLDQATREFMESGFGHDFSSVRIQSNEPAARSADELGARAFTVGNTIAFGRGEYNPHTSEGRLLLAHELAHVVQNSNDPTQRLSAKVIGSPTSQSKPQTESATQADRDLRVRVWINSFIPRDVGGSEEVPEGAHKGQRMIHAPLSRITGCFLTDNRGFSNDPKASSRMHLGFEFMVGEGPLNLKSYPMEPWCDRTTQLHCEDGNEECTDNATIHQTVTQVPGHSQSVNDSTLQESFISFTAAASDPCLFYAPDIDFSGTVVSNKANGELRYDVMLDSFPAFEMYAQVGNGDAIPLINSLPPSGNSPWNLFGENVRRVVGQISLPISERAPGNDPPTLLAKGMASPSVYGLQSSLIRLGYLPKNRADCRFGAETEAAVKAFQMDNELAVDGVAGPLTRRCLDNQFRQLDSIPMSPIELSSPYNYSYLIDKKKLNPKDYEDYHKQSIIQPFEWSGGSTKFDFHKPDLWNMFQLKSEGSTMYVNDKITPNNFVNLMLGRFVTGVGPVRFVFPENGAVSKEMGHAAIVREAIQGWYTQNSNLSPTRSSATPMDLSAWKGDVGFGFSEQLEAYKTPGLGNLALGLQFPSMLPWVLGQGTLNIPNLVGSATIDIVPIGDTLHITIHNVTSATSGDILKHFKYLGYGEAPSFDKDTLSSAPQPFTNIIQEFRITIPIDRWRIELLPMDEKKKLYDAETR